MQCQIASSQMPTWAALPFRYIHIPISMSFPCSRPRSLFVPRLNITISPAQINAQKASEWFFRDDAKNKSLWSYWSHLLTWQKTSTTLVSRNFCIINPEENAWQHDTWLNQEKRDTEINLHECCCKSVKLNPSSNHLPRSSYDQPAQLVMVDPVY